MTTIRESLATGMPIPMLDQKYHLATLAQHKAQTKANYYRIHDKVTATDLGRRAVKKVVSHNADKRDNLTPIPWTEGVLQRFLLP